MLKWLGSTFAFIFLVAALGAFTMNILLTSALGSTDVITDTLEDQETTLIEQTFDKFLSELSPEQKKQFDELDALTPDQKEAALGEQCQQDDLQGEPFCDPAFISGSITVYESIKKSIGQKVDESQGDAVTQVQEQLSGYQKYPLKVITILGFILSLILFMVTKGALAGVEMFSGNIAWLSLMSAISYKLMPSFFDKIITATQEGGAEGASNVAQSIISAWLTPAIQKAFVASVWLTLGGFIVWLAIMLFRKYSVEVEY